MKAPRTMMISVILLLSFPLTAASQVSPDENAARPKKARPDVRTVRSTPSTFDGRAGAASQPVLPELSQTIAVRHLWGDLDGDGLRELFVLDRAGNMLFRNRGDGGFEEVTAMAFPEGAGRGGTGFFGDFNGDGRQDLFLFLEEGFVLLRNEGKLRFSDVTETLGLPADLKGARVQLEDYDNDGFGDLLVQTPERDRIFRNQDGRSFNEVKIVGPRRGSGGMVPVPPIQSPGGAAGPGSGSRGGMTADAIFLNDNSPGSVGIGVPEVEGGDDGTTLNDIVDGTVTGDDIQDSSVTGIDIANGTISSSDIKNGTITGTDIADESVTGADIEDHSLTGSDVKDESLTGKDIADASVTSIDVQDETLTGTDILDGSLTGSDIANGSIAPGKVTGTAATLSGNQAFDKGTFFIDAANNRVGIGTMSPSISSLHVDSDETYGCRVETSTTPAWAVYGRASAQAGTANGVYGESKSTSGRGLYGRAKAATGTTYGVRGESESTTGRGVYGLASATTGENYGVKGHSSSTSGRGVYGSGAHTGVEGFSTGTASGYSYGVYGESSADGGCGVYGKGEYSVRGESAYSTARAVSGYASSSSGITYGLYGTSASDSGRGVYGLAPHIGVEAHATTGIYNYGVYSDTNSSYGYGVYSAGDFGCSGTKSFVQPHPKDPSKEIRFVCLEGNESGTYFRGSSTLENGRAVIEVPEAFRLVTEEEGLTVQITPLCPARIWIEEYNLDRVVISGDEDVDFHYFVNGVRRGFADHEPIRENHEWVPEYKDKPYGTQYPETLRKILVENGTLNPDFTPNKKTAAKMGWTLRDYDEERLHDGDPKDQDIGDTTADSSHKQEIDRVERASRLRRTSSDPDLKHSEAMDRPEREKLKPTREDRPEREKLESSRVDSTNREKARMDKDA